MVKVLDSKFEGCEFKTHTRHGSFSKLRQFRLPYFASVYSAANEYKHCLEGPVQESQYNCTLSCFALQKPGLSTGHISLHGFLRHNAWGMTLPLPYHRRVRPITKTMPLASKTSVKDDIVNVDRNKI